MKKFSQNRGFTLIELLVVISIISVLSSIILVALNGAKDKGRVGAALEFSSTNYHSLGAYTFSSYANGSSQYSSPLIADTSGNSMPLNCSNPANIEVVSDAPAGTNSIHFETGSASCAFTSSTNVPLFGNASAYTVSVWVKFLSSSATMIFQGFDNYSYTNLFYLRCNSGNCSAITFGSDSVPSPYTANNYPLSLNKWYNLTASFNLTTNESLYYIDGHLVHQDVYESNDAITNGGIGQNYINIQGSDIYINSAIIYNSPIM